MMIAYPVVLYEVRGVERGWTAVCPVVEGAQTISPTLTRALADIAKIIERRLKDGAITYSTWEYAQVQVKG